MGVVDFDHEIGERELQLMGPQPPGLVHPEKTRLRPTGITISFI